MVIESPYEILELKDGEVARFNVIRFETGEMEIKPRYQGAPRSKMIPVLRVHVPEQHKTYFPRYWDITSKTLIAQLTPFLARKDFGNILFTITAHGTGPQKRFGVVVSMP